VPHEDKQIGRRKKMYSGVDLISNLSLLDWSGFRFVNDSTVDVLIPAHVKGVNKMSSEHTPTTAAD